MVYTAWRSVNAVGVSGGVENVSSRGYTRPIQIWDESLDGRKVGLARSSFGLRRNPTAAFVSPRLAARIPGVGELVPPVSEITIPHGALFKIPQLGNIFADSE